MRIATSAVCILFATLLVFCANLPVFGTSIDIISQEPYVQVLVGGYDQAPGTLSEPLEIRGEVYNGGGALSESWNVVEWINAAPPATANEWSYSGEVSGGIYDGGLGYLETLLQPGANTADALWMETGDSAWATSSVSGDIFAIALKADDNDGIADFYVDDVLVATIDLYHDEDAGYEINRAPFEDPNGDLGPYYLPVLVVVDMTEQNHDPLPAIDNDINDFSPHTLKIVASAPSIQAPHFTDDVEILGMAVMTTNEPILPEPGSLAVFGSALLLLRRRNQV